MEKIVSLIIIMIFLLSGIKVGVTYYQQHIEYNPRVTKEWVLKLLLKAGFIGYHLTVANNGNESINGSLTINLTTDA